MYGDLTEFDVELLLNQLRDQWDRSTFLFQYDPNKVYDNSCAFRTVIDVIKDMHDKNIMLDCMEKTINVKQALIYQLNEQLNEQLEKNN